jgi:hypothetical protein
VLAPAPDGHVYVSNQESVKNPRNSLSSGSEPAAFGANRGTREPIDGIDRMLFIELALGPP